MTKTRTRNDHAREVIEDAVRAALKSPAPVKCSVAAADNHSGEPSLYIYIEMASERDIPDLASRNRLVTTLLDALRQIDEDRFPYVSFGPREGDTSGEENVFDSDGD